MRGRGLKPGMPLCGGGFSQAMEDAIALSALADMLFIAAAGNSGGGASYSIGRRQSSNPFTTKVQYLLV
jgi:hypothetical protein